jgi:hypothetical protein
MLPKHFEEVSAIALFLSLIVRQVRIILDFGLQDGGFWRIVLFLISKLIDH